jgi:hypothetical protein
MSEPFNPADLSEDQRFSVRAYEAGDPCWLAASGKHADLREALVACATELSHPPSKPEYVRWRQRRKRRGEDPPPLSFIAVYFWGNALYDSGLIADPSDAPRTRGNPGLFG